MNSPVGGDPTTIEAGSQGLATEAAKLPSLTSMVTRTSGSCSAALARPELDAMMTRLSTAWSTYLHDLEVQMTAAARLAQSGSADLAAATGGPR